MDADTTVSAAFRSTATCTDSKLHAQTTSSTTSSSMPPSGMQTVSESARATSAANAPMQTAAPSQTIDVRSGTHTLVAHDGLVYEPFDAPLLPQVRIQGHACPGQPVYELYFHAPPPPPPPPASTLETQLPRKFAFVYCSSAQCRRAVQRQCEHCWQYYCNVHRPKDPIFCQIQTCMYRPAGYCDTCYTRMCTLHYYRHLVDGSVFGRGCRLRTAGLALVRMQSADADMRDFQLDRTATNIVQLDHIASVDSSHAHTQPVSQKGPNAMKQDAHGHSTQARSIHDQCLPLSSMATKCGKPPISVDLTMDDDHAEEKHDLGGLPHAALSSQRSVHDDVLDQLTESMHGVGNARTIRPPAQRHLKRRRLVHPEDTLEGQEKKQEFTTPIACDASAEGDEPLHSLRCSKRPKRTSVRTHDQNEGNSDSYALTTAERKQIQSAADDALVQQLKIATRHPSLPPNIQQSLDSAWDIPWMRKRLLWAHAHPDRNVLIRLDRDREHAEMKQGKLADNIRVCLDEPDPRKRIHANVHVVTVENDYPCPALVGQRGLAASGPIAKDSVIAEYFGRWITNEEADREDATNKFLFEVNCMPLHHLQQKLDTAVLDASNGYGNGVAEYVNDFRIIVDPPDDKRNLRWWINTKIVVVCYRGRVHVLFVAKNNIAKKDYILADYSPRYWETEAQSAAQEEQRAIRATVSSAVMTRSTSHQRMDDADMIATVRRSTRKTHRRVRTDV